LISGVERLNRLPREEAIACFLSCCGSKEWARRMEEARPFGDLPEPFDAADRIWRSLSEADWLEAFRAHPRIGERAAGQAGQEQSGTRGASPETLASLQRANREYEEKFGRIFLVCATGRSAEEMLALCRQRLHNDPREELRVAAEEQRKVTRLRLEKLLAA